MKFFQKPGVAVVFTIVMIAALFIGLSPVLKSDKPAETAQTAVPEQTISQTPAEEQTSNTAGDETISDKYIRDDAGLFTRSGENAIQDYNTKIYNKTGSHIAILTTDGTGGKTLESCTNSAFDSMGLSEYDMLFAIDTSTEQWYVTTGSYVADYTDSKLERCRGYGVYARAGHRTWQEEKHDRYNYHDSGHFLDHQGHFRLRPQRRRRRRLLVGPVFGLTVLEPSSPPRPRPGAWPQTRRFRRRPQTRRRQPRRLWRRPRRFRRRSRRVRRWPQIKNFPA